MRQSDFTSLALALPPKHFHQLMSRDDLTCNEEADVLALVETYISRKTADVIEETRKELVECVRFDKLPNDKLIELSRGGGFSKGFEQVIIDALCRKLKAYELQSGGKLPNTRDRNYVGKGKIASEKPVSVAETVSAPISTIAPLSTIEATTAVEPPIIKNLEEPQIVSGEEEHWYKF